MLCYLLYKMVWWWYGCFVYLKFELFCCFCCQCGLLNDGLLILVGDSQLNWWCWFFVVDYIILYCGDFEFFWDVINWQIFCLDYYDIIKQCEEVWGFLNECGLDGWLVDLVYFVNC